MVEYAWPEAKDRRLIGTRISRLDGPAKATGAAKYTYDVHPPRMLYGALLLCPHARARIRRLDTTTAAAAPGVKALEVINGEGTEIKWALDDVVALCATSEEAALDAVALIQIEYDVLEHFVRGDLLEAAPKVEAGEHTQEGDPTGAMASAAVRHQGRYGQPRVAHNCLEAHGHICEWTGPDTLATWSSTQALSAAATQFAEALEIPAANVHVVSPFIGGGFGSKFNIDRWGAVCARLARQAGAPVRLMLPRAAELTAAGDRPSAYADIEIGADRDGKVTSWISKSWGSGGLGGAGSPPTPYIFRFPNVSHQQVSVSTHTASARAWRAPNHPQACFLTFAALDDLAAKLQMDPLEFFRKNLPATGRLEPLFAEELEVADTLMGWKERWRPRGDASHGRGIQRHGLGMALHTWGGRGHASNCAVTLYPDGAATARISTQDIGTGTRTVVGVVLAETLGLPVSAVHAEIGDSRYPTSGGSGGSTTVGGVSAATRRAAQNALAKLFEKAAARLECRPEELEAVDGSVRIKSDPARRISWKQAAGLLGVTPLTANGSNPGPGDLTGSGTAGLQMAEVTVDIETGIVHVDKMIAVQECGLIIDLKTTESQVYGGMVMGISYALTEEKITDPVTGRMLNVDFESYRMAGLGDIGELVVHMMTGPRYDERGVIGVGEPPVIAPGAAISNAVANAIGVRVPTLPITPEHVLDALRPTRSTA